MTPSNRSYILWRRVSTKEQGNSELGLKAQVAIAEYFMKSEPEKIFTDVYSGTKLSECKNLWEAIKYCKQTGKLLVIAKTDRFRNVAEALTILDEIGEGNLVFCDLPTTDRTVLTIVFALWERQAIQGRINTKLALEERKKQAKEQGGWQSKSGKFRTRLGRPADRINENGEEIFDTSAAVAAASISHTKRKNEWRKNSPAFKWVISKIGEGMPRRQVVKEFNELHELQPDVFCTPQGKKLSEGILSYWLKDYAV